MPLLIIAALQAACARGSAEPSHAAVSIVTKPALGQGTPAQNVTNAYLVLQAQLVNDEFKAARISFDRVHSAAQASALPITPALRKRIDDAALQGGAAADLPRQRVAFGALSDALIAWFRTQDNPLADGLSVAHCPMAFEGKGAKWIQRGEQIANPYFGTEMSTCGNVEAAIPAGKKL
jgi:hypothetical protein